MHYRKQPSCRVYQIHGKASLRHGRGFVVCMHTEKLTLQPTRRQPSLSYDLLPRPRLHGRINCLVDIDSPLWSHIFPCAKDPYGQPVGMPGCTHGNHVGPLSCIYKRQRPFGLFAYTWQRSQFLYFLLISFYPCILNQFAIFAKLCDFLRVVMEMDCLEIVDLWDSRADSRAIVACCMIF
jgi:hypothetical protein